MKTIYILLLIISPLLVTGQQLPIYSQYFLNDYAFNPGIAGTQDFYQIKSNNRYQWVGITDAPRTYVLSVNGPHKNLDMGFGGVVFNDVTGPTSRTGIYGTYAYNLIVKDEMKLSMGLTLGLLQFKVDASKIVFHDNDPRYENTMYVNYKPDASFGAYLYDKKYYFGIAANQLFNNRVFKDQDSAGLNRLKPHLIIHGGYTINITDEFDFEPIVMGKFVSPAPLQFDLGARVVYRKMVWLGSSWRTKDAVSIYIGYNHHDQFIFGYSYDIPLTNIRMYSTGSHELMITARFNKIKESKWKAKI